MPISVSPNSRKVREPYGIIKINKSLFFSELLSRFTARYNEIIRSIIVKVYKSPLTNTRVYKMITKKNPIMIR
ncbi:MAG: hypothetical protein IJI42_04205 [Methanobrevibacter sp.]|nr:hypothetical protein [Methanobrevibacter sp.]